jgi:hypothetical protein
MCSEDAIALAIECDAVLSDRRTILQHGERVFAGIVGESGGRSNGPDQRRRDQQ